MADFSFYKDVFLGELIPEKNFASLAQRAREVLQGYERSYRVNIPGEDSYRMAICAMAETLYTYGKRRTGVTSASVGEVSVRYEGVTIPTRLCSASFTKTHRSIWTLPGG